MAVGLFYALHMQVRAEQKFKVLRLLNEILDAKLRMFLLTDILPGVKYAIQNLS
jgi:hypothetical protein